MSFFASTGRSGLVKLTQRVKTRLPKNPNMINLGNGNHVRADHILRVERYNALSRIMFEGDIPYRSLVTVNEQDAEFGGEAYTKRIPSTLSTDEVVSRLKEANNDH